MSAQNARGVRLLYEIVGDRFKQAETEAMVKAAISCEAVDLDALLTEYSELQGVFGEINVEAERIRTKIVALEAEIVTLTRRRTALLAQKEELVVVTPLGFNKLKIALLFSFMHEILEAVVSARNYFDLEAGHGFAYYHLKFLANFILPALEGRLPEDWSEDGAWNTIVDAQIVHRAFSGLPKSRDFSPLKILEDLKKTFTPYRLNILVSGVCGSEQIGADQLRTFITRMREVAVAESWPAEYLS